MKICNPSNFCTALFSLGIGANGVVVPAGSSKSFEARVNSAGGNISATGESQAGVSLSVSMNDPEDISLDGAGTSLRILNPTAPISISNVIYSL